MKMKAKKKLFAAISGVLAIVVAAAIFYIAGAPKIENDTDIINIGEYSVKPDEYKAWTLPSKLYYEQALDDDSFFNSFSGRKFGKELLQSINENIIGRYVCLGMADRMGIYLTDEELQSSRDAFESDVEAGMDTYGISDELYFRLYYSDQMREDKLLDYIYSELEKEIGEETISQYITENRLTGVQQILIRNDPEDSEDDNKMLAEDILRRLERGESFYELMHQYSEDRTLVDYPDGWVLSLDDEQYAEYFIEELEALEPYETSGVIEYGDEWQSWYLIIYRIPPMEDSVKDLLLEEEVELEITGYTDDTKISYCDGFKRIQLKDVESY